MLVTFEYSQKYNGILPGSRQEMILGMANTLANRGLGQVIDDGSRKTKAKAKVKAKVKDNADSSDAAVES